MNTLVSSNIHMRNYDKTINLVMIIIIKGP